MDDFETYQEIGTGSFAKYISEDFNAYDNHKYDLNYVSDPTTLGSPMETTLRAWLTDSAGKSWSLTHNLIIFIKSKDMVCRCMHYNNRWLNRGKIGF